MNEDTVPFDDDEPIRVTVVSARCCRCLDRFEFEKEPDDGDNFICTQCQMERARPVPPLDVEATFGPGGPLAGGNPNYEARPGQVALARSIFDSLAGGKHLLAEGPCGIGKSKAYGVPAAWLAANGKKVLIVTASIALQEQLIRKDLPALQNELPWDFDFGLMKGKSNYLCKEQVEKADDQGVFGGELDEYDTLVAWSKKTKTGDKSELSIKPSEKLWGRFSTSSDACPGKKCPSYSSCFAMRARREAAQAGIIVTNYHLFFLDMAAGGTILPHADVVILDEAHEAADIARDVLGFRISIPTFMRFARDAEKNKPAATLEAEALKLSAHAFFSTLVRFATSGHYHQLLRWAAPFGCEELERAVQMYVSACAKSHLAEKALAAIARIKEALTVSNDNCVYSIELSDDVTRGKKATLQGRYIRPGPVLRSMLWGSYDSVVAVSATLTADRSFEFARGELGAPEDAGEIVVETPFDFMRQAMIVLPDRQCPEPSAGEFVHYAASQTIATIEACGGRTLGLFTSYRVLDQVAERVRKHFGGKVAVYTQRDGPAGLLAEKFKRETRSVLLGTSSFWTGIDVPGEALTGLVIDRLPFPSPDDPVSVRINETNPRAFADHTTPRAILMWRQGVGRLIRSQRDVGAIVVLDKRVVTKGYGSRFLKSLPVMARGASPADIEAFLRARGVAA